MQDILHPMGKIIVGEPVASGLCVQQDGSAGLAALTLKFRRKQARLFELLEHSGLKIPERASMFITIIL